MNIITKRDKIRQAFKDFDHDNRDKKDSDTSWKGWTFGDMRVALARLDPDKCSAEDVSNILNESWVSLICDECNKECNVLLHIGQPEDYDNRWWDMCHDCLSSGMKMMEGEA